MLPAVYINYTSQNFCLFHLSNLSVLNFRTCLLMYPGSETGPGRLTVAPFLPLWSRRNRSPAPATFISAVADDAPPSRGRFVLVDGPSAGQRRRSAQKDRDAKSVENRSCRGNNVTMPVHWHILPAGTPKFASCSGDTILTGGEVRIKSQMTLRIRLRLIHSLLAPSACPDRPHRSHGQSHAPQAPPALSARIAVPASSASRARIVRPHRPHSAAWIASWHNWIIFHLLKMCLFHLRNCHILLTFAQLTAKNGVPHTYRVHTTHTHCSLILNHANTKFIPTTAPARTGGGRLQKITFQPLKSWNDPHFYLYELQGPGMAPLRSYVDTYCLAFKFGHSFSKSWVYHYLPSLWFWRDNSAGTCYCQIFGNMRRSNANALKPRCNQKHAASLLAFCSWSKRISVSQ